jgi:hypothetical protein
VLGMAKGRGFSESIKKESPIEAPSDLKDGRCSLLDRISHIRTERMIGQAETFRNRMGLKTYLGNCVHIVPNQRDLGHSETVVFCRWRISTVSV